MIISGKIEGIACIYFDKIVISDSPSALEDDIDNLKTDYSNIYYTAGSGNIGIRTFPDNTTVIRRESDWLN